MVSNWSTNASGLLRSSAMSLTAATVPLGTWRATAWNSRLVTSVTRSRSRSRSASQVVSTTVRSPDGWSTAMRSFSTAWPASRSSGDSPSHVITSQSGPAWACAVASASAGSTSGVAKS